MRENRPYGSEGGEQRYCSPTPIDTRAARHAREAWPPASAGATSFVVVPALGRDPDTRAARHARKAWTPASAGATTGTRVAHAMNRFQRWIAPNFFACRVIGQIYSG